MMNVCHYLILIHLMLGNLQFEVLIITILMVYKRAK